MIITITLVTSEFSSEPAHKRRPAWALADRTNGSWLEVKFQTEHYVSWPTRLLSLHAEMMTERGKHVTWPKCWLVHKSICATALRLKKTFYQIPLEVSFFIHFIKIERGPKWHTPYNNYQSHTRLFCRLLCILSFCSKRCGSWTAPYQGPKALYPS